MSSPGQQEKPIKKPLKRECGLFPAQAGRVGTGTVPAKSYMFSSWKKG